jgi:hypothetical protein
MSEDFDALDEIAETCSTSGNGLWHGARTNQQRHAKEVCKNGHAMTEANVRWARNGARGRHRVCIACDRARKRRPRCPAT